MTRLALALLIFSNACSAFDIRDILSPGSVPSGLENVIIPDESIYSIRYGITEDKFIKKYGKPNGYLRITKNEIGMIYGYSHLFFFRNKKLSGVRITTSIIDWKLSKLMTEDSKFSQISWELDNGISRETTLDDVKKILKDKLRGSQYTKWYDTENSRVHIDFSHYTAAGESDDAYRVHGIMIREK